VGKLGRLDLAICVQQVLDELACPDVEISLVAMLEAADVELVDSSDELLLDSSMDVAFLLP
jgi:hypothetical protein